MGSTMSQSQWREMPEASICDPETTDPTGDVGEWNLLHRHLA